MTTSFRFFIHPVLIIGFALAQLIGVGREIDPETLRAGGTKSASASVLPIFKLVCPSSGGDDFNLHQSVGGADLLKTPSTQFLPDLAGVLAHKQLPDGCAFAGRVRDGLSRAPPIT